MRGAGPGRRPRGRHTGSAAAGDEGRPEACDPALGPVRGGAGRRPGTGDDGSAIRAGRLVLDPSGAMTRTALLSGERGCRRGRASRSLQIVIYLSIFKIVTGIRLCQLHQAKRPSGGRCPSQRYRWVVPSGAWRLGHLIRASEQLLHRTTPRHAPPQGFKSALGCGGCAGFCGLLRSGNVYNAFKSML